MEKLVDRLQNARLYLRFPFNVRSQTSQLLKVDPPSKVATYVIPYAQITYYGNPPWISNYLTSEIVN